MMKYDVSYDVVVAGGGIAGVAAAIQAARSGKKTALVEKTVLLGGLATTGLVYIYLPLCDGNGHQVTFGLSEELLQRSMKYGPGSVDPNWDHAVNAPEIKRYRCIFSPAAFILSIDEMLEENGVDVWLDTLICDSEVENDRVSAIVCENKSGRGRLRAKCFVDATGDCDVIRRADIPCHDDYNYLTNWTIQYDANATNSEFGPKINSFTFNVDWDPEKAPAGTVFRGLTGKTVSEFVLKSRKTVRDHYKKEYEKGTHDRHSLYALKVPAMAQFRKTYSLDSAYDLDSGENNRFFEDSIGLVADWRVAGPVWEIPYRTLYPKNKMGGILAAGRCTGAKGDAWEITRVIPVAAMTGQVAGLAAAMSIDAGVKPADLDVKQLQEKLRGLGFPLHLKDVGL